MVDRWSWCVGGSVLVVLSSQTVLQGSWLVGHLARGEVPDLINFLVNLSVSLVG